MLAVALTLSAAGCGEGGGSTQPPKGPTALQRAQQKWERSGIRSYRFRVTRPCLCPPTDRFGPATVTVRDGRPVKRPPSRLPATVEELFKTVSDGERGPGTTTVTYDPRFGVPTTIHIDPGPNVNDDETTINVERFTRLAG